jgi:CDP-4-dehydro-6-deoxyglucose reductase
MIQRGELATFEGMVDAEELLRAYPEVKLEDDAGLERLERIKDAAFTQRMRERILPGADVLVARLTQASRDLAEAQARSDAYRDTMDRLCVKLRDMAGAAVTPDTPAALLAWLQDQLKAALLGEPLPGLLVQDRFMRIMTAHVQIRPSGHEYFVEGSDTLLESALRAGFAVDYGCSGGSCGKCRRGSCRGRCRRRAIPTTPSPRPKRAPGSCSCAATPPSSTS